MTLLVIHLVATAMMAGLIWFVQVVHYPLFDLVGAEQSVQYAHEHQRRTSYVVGAPMAVEGVTALALFFRPPSDLGSVWPFVGLVLLGIVHASTVFLQVPQHARLAQAHDPARVRFLVRTNWIRTIGWTARAVLAAFLVVAGAQ